MIEFWVPDEDTRIEKLQGYINSFTSSVDRLGNAPSTRTYLAELRIQMAQRMLEKMKSRAPSGALASGEAEKHLIDYLDAYPQSVGCGGGGWQQNVSGEGACAPFYRNGGYSGMMKGWIAPSWWGSSNR